MTEKELLYVEDAILHETSIINFCNDYLEKLDDERFLKFMTSQKESHEEMKNKLITLLKEEANE